MKYSSNFKEEVSHLDWIVSKLDKQIKESEIKKQQAAEALKEMYTMYTPDSPEYYNLIPIQESLKQLYTKELNDYRKAINKPYFGKIICSYEDNEELKIYIGKKGLTDGDNATSLLVIDWRAPISEVYYSNNLGETSFNTELGETKVDLKLKTTFEIKDSKLIDLYDSEIIANDDLLVKYLSKNKDVVLNEIIATIQQDQNKIIRFKANKNIIVQGVAGSGKTTVALHRIAYLLYNYSKTISPDSIYIIASNELFLKYITSMLPDLDVHNINQGTLTNILIDCIKDYVPTFKFKENNKFYEFDSLIKTFDNYFKQLETKLFYDEIKIFNINILLIEDIKLLLQNKESDILTKATILDNRISYLLSFNKDKILNFVLDNRNDENIKTEAKKLFSITKEDIFEDDLVPRFKTLTGKYKNYFKNKVKQLKYIEIFKEINTQLGMNFEISMAMSINDLALILLILDRIEKKPFFKYIKHIVIDEAQDLNALLYYCLKTVFNNSKFTIVGDIMQNIEPNGLHDFKTIINNVFQHDVEYLTLLKSYRNTIEISNYAKSIVEFYTKSKFETQPVIRHGNEVKTYKYKNEEEKLKYLPKILKELENTNCKLNAIICKDEETVNNLYKQTKQIPNIDLLLTSMEQLNFKNYIVSLKNSKGLEFDGVVIWDFDLYDLKNESYDYKLLYVATTRALHELHVFTNNNLFQKN